ncbi:MAG: hypothetical protein ACRC5C_13185 [Bacilli bacterium]
MIETTFDLLGLQLAECAYSESSTSEFKVTFYSHELYAAIVKDEGFAPRVCLYVYVRDTSTSLFEAEFGYTAERLMYALDDVSEFLEAEMRKEIALREQEFSLMYSA